MSRLSHLARSALMRAGLRYPQPPPLPDPGSVVLDAQGITVRFGARTVLDSVDIEIRAGEVVGLVGPNGAGKSTLLTMLSGDGHASAEAGRVYLYDRPLAEWTPPELALRRAVLPQQTAVSFPFEVAEIVAMGRAPWAGIRSAESDEEIVAEALASTETADLARRRFPSLSGGEKARVALARVLAQKAPIMLLDEPTAALDIRHQELVLRLARERARFGAAVVVVLHDLGLAAAYTDQVAVLSNARIAAYGAPEEVFTAPLLSEVYQQEVEVLSHPRSGVPLVLPVREEGAQPPGIQ